MGCGSSQPAKHDVREATSVSVEKLHTAIRWNHEKETATMIAADPTAILQVDPKTGNTALHISAQNGHLPLMEMVIARSPNRLALVNSQNNLGHTALHMATSYELYAAAHLLRQSGADEQLRNHDGCEARFGLSGEMNPQCTPYKLNQLRKASSTDELLSAFAGLQGCADVDKAKLVQTAMDKKKDLKAMWRADVQGALTALMKSL